MEIRIGPAGTGGDSLKGMERARELKLSACEIEYTHGIKMSNATAKKVGEAAKKNGIKLSVHAPYFINLNSDDRKKLEASKKRILTSCERAHHLGAERVVFHPGFYGRTDRETTFQNIKEAMVEMQKEIKRKKWKVKLAPETTGKLNVFGSLDEILRLVKETKCSFCVDFAHLKARGRGRIDYGKVLEKLKGFKHIHCHMSGIEYTDKGERRHLMTDRKEIAALAKAMLKAKINATIINESPDIFGDAVLGKEVFESLGYKF